MTSRAAELILWTSLALVAYSYAGYPLLIWTCARLFGRRREIPAAADADWPAVTLLIAAHNEERWIGPRLENALAQDYPLDRLEVLVASDGSRDATVTIASAFAARGVRVLDFPENRGKATVLNAGIQEARHPLVVFSDANTFFEPEAMRRLVRWFADPAVGAVCGRLVLTDPRKGRNVDSLYWKYETFLKKCESRLGALLGANGAIYALRKEDYVPIPPDTLVDDFVIPLVSKLKTGKGVIYDDEAVAWEESPPGIGDEFRRRSRIGAGGFQALLRLLPLLSPARGWVAFSFLSHKVLRWLSPFLLVLALAANLSCLDSTFHAAVLATQVAFYLVSAVGAYLPGRGTLSKLIRLPAMFTSMNLALLAGFWNWLAGPQRGAWQRTTR
jgi:cellulose synthase/poly-beta-1,6-N-acetylglucosamine synthase-like glycosyltransferase